MTTRNFRLGAAVMILGAAAAFSTLRATPDKPGKDTSAATASPTPSASLDAADATALRAHLNETIEAHGAPIGTGQSKTGSVCYLNFAQAHQGLAVVFFTKSSAAHGVSTENDLKQYVGKTVSVTGKLTDYKGDLQITVEATSQIKVTTP